MSQMVHDSVITAQCFSNKEKTVPWCYGELIIIICGILTVILSIWCLYRMFKYQNEAKSAVRSFIIYLSIILSLITILHGLFIDGSSMSLTASFLVSVQCSLFTVFFIKICIRTNSDTLSISMDCERIFQFIFLLIMILIEIGFFLWSLITFDENEIDCHSPPFMAFSCIDVLQILCTIIAVCFIKRKIKKKHQIVKNPQNKQSYLIPNQSPPNIQPISVINQDMEQQQLGQIQMLQKSHQLLLLVIFIFISAVVTAVYETWNFLTKQDCSTFIKHHDVLNEIFRLIARITWLFIPSWLIIYVFWIWPSRPKKYISDDSLRRRQLKKQESIEKRNRILNKICCYCLNDDYDHDDEQQEHHQYNGYNQFNDHNIENGINGDHHHHHHQQRKNSLIYHYDSDNRIISEIDDNDQNQGHNASLAQYPMNQTGDNDGNINDNNIDNIHNGDIYDESSSSSSSLESDSMRRSDIWEQHITTEHIRSGSNVLSHSITHQTQHSHHI